MGGQPRNGDHVPGPRSPPLQSITETTPRPGAEEIVGSTQDIRVARHWEDGDLLRFVKRFKMAPSELQVDGVAGASGKTLDLKVIGLNCGTSVDGIDCVHVHYTQEHPDAPLKMELLNYDEGTIPVHLIPSQRSLSI
jgi:hypothetical protein